MLVKRRGHEEPDLVQHHRRRQHDADVDAEGDDQIKIAGGMRVNQFRIKVRVRKRLEHRARNEFDNVLRDVNADKRADANCNQRIDDARAQLNEVLEEGHLPAGLGILFRVVARGHCTVSSFSYW